jgi:hypothetical protein
MVRFITVYALPEIWVRNTSEHPLRRLAAARSISLDNERIVADSEPLHVDGLSATDRNCHIKCRNAASGELPIILDNSACPDGVSRHGDNFLIRRNLGLTASEW